LFTFRRESSGASVETPLPLASVVVVVMSDLVC
jgi:hypothetical protein